MKAYSHEKNGGELHSKRQRASSAIRCVIGRIFCSPGVSPGVEHTVAGVGSQDAWRPEGQKNSYRQAHDERSLHLQGLGSQQRRIVLAFCAVVGLSRMV